jgi:hypothetical protein
MTVWPSSAYCNFMEWRGVESKGHANLRRKGELRNLQCPWIMDWRFSGLGVLHQKRHQKHAEDLEVEGQINLQERALNQQKLSMDAELEGQQLVIEKQKRLCQDKLANATAWCQLMQVLLSLLLKRWSVT